MWNVKEELGLCLNLKASLRFLAILAEDPGFIHIHGSFVP